MASSGATVLAVAALVSVATLLTGCGQRPGDALARRACAYVDRSVQLYVAAEQTTDAGLALTRRDQALAQLRLALPLAAQATSDNGQWVALETTISESARVEESHLLVALRQECAVAESTTPNQPPFPTTLPPAP